jgi:hypothetical protein
MTSRRFVLAAADHLATAISLAFWLNFWAEADPYGTGTQPAVKAALGAAAHSIPTSCAPGFSGAGDELDRLERVGRRTVAPLGAGGSARPWTALAQDIRPSSSPGPEQIPLLVGALEGLQSGLGHALVGSRRRALGGKSLNPNLSLEWSAA